MYESATIIGDKQYQFAKSLMNAATETVSGAVDYRHSFVDMSRLVVNLTNPIVHDHFGTIMNITTATLCSPALGYSFAAGTTDGPGAFGFTQGSVTGNPFWDKVRSLTLYLCRCAMFESFFMITTTL